jgi:hypothetical protein
MVPEQQQTSPAPAGSPWARTTMWVSIVLVPVAGGLLAFRSCVMAPERTIEKAGQTIERAGDTLATVAAAFKQGSITTSFVSHAATLTNNHYLQFATLNQIEIFARTEEPSTAFGYLPLPGVVVEARAPVSYTYYVDLNAKWEFVLRDNIVHVHAPPIRANRPAVDVSALSYEVRKGHFKTAEALENLKRAITSLVVLRAQENIPLVRETGRRQTSEFVESWLGRTFSDGKAYHVKVFFPGESTPDALNFMAGPLD